MGSVRSLTGDILADNFGINARQKHTIQRDVLLLYAMYTACFYNVIVYFVFMIENKSVGRK